MYLYLLAIIIYQILKQYRKIQYSRKQLHNSCQYINYFLNYPNTMLLIGDSTVIGYGTPNCNDTISYHLGKLSKSNIDVIGESGYKIAQVEKLFYKVKKPYKIIVIIAGANDIMSLDNLNDVPIKLTNLIKTTKCYGKHIFITHSGKIWNSDIFVFPINYVMYFRALKMRRIYQQLSKELGFTYIDMFNPSSTICGNGAHECSIDGLHFDKRGNYVWAETIYETIKNTIV